MWQLALLALVPATGPAEAIDLIARINSVALELPRAGAEPFLSEGGWVIDGHIVSQPRIALLQRAKQTHNWTGQPSDPAAIIVSLGSKPTFEAFLRTARSLREMGLCLIFVKEGGEAVGTEYLDVPGLTIC